MSVGRSRGFAFIEILVSMAIMLTVTSIMLGFVSSARRVFAIDLERADMQQRARSSMAAMFRDLVMAGAGMRMAAIAPLRRGDEHPDVPGSAFVDRISVRYAPPDAAPGDFVTITYALRPDATGVLQMMRYDGRKTDLPVADQVVSLHFAYFDASGHQLALTRFSDGPWIADAVTGDPIDVDLQVINRVRAVIRVRPARTFVGLPLADIDVRIDVSPRNLNLP